MSSTIRRVAVTIEATLTLDAKNHADYPADIFEGIGSSGLIDVDETVKAMAKYVMEALDRDVEMRVVSARIVPSKE